MSRSRFGARLRTARARARGWSGSSTTREPSSRADRPSQSCIAAGDAIPALRSCGRFVERRPVFGPQPPDKEGSWPLLPPPRGPVDRDAVFAHGWRSRWRLASPPLQPPRRPIRRSPARTPLLLTTPCRASARAPARAPDILYAPPAQAPQLENTGVWKAAADPGLRRQRLPRRRVPLPGLPLRRPRRARRRRDPADPRTGATPSRCPTGTYTYPTDAAYAEQRRRPRRAARQAAGRRDRLPHHAQHAQGPVAGRVHDRDRRLAVAARRSRTAPTSSAPAAALPDRARRLRRAGRRSHRTRTAPVAAIAVDGRHARAARSRCASRTRPGTRAERRSAWRPAPASGTRRPAAT